MVDRTRPFHCIQHSNPPVMMTMTRSRLALLLVQLLCWIALARASIVRGFATKESPELKDLPNIADQVRKLSSKIRVTSKKASSKPPRGLQAGKSSKSEGPKEVIDTTNQNDPGRAGHHPVGKQDEASSIPEAAPEFNSAGELSFVMVRAALTFRLQNRQTDRHFHVAAGPQQPYTSSLRPPSNIIILSSWTNSVTIAIR